MIKTKQQLKECLKNDYKYYNKGAKNKIRDVVTSEHLTQIWKYIKYLRYEEYYLNTNKKFKRLHHNNNEKKKQ